MITQPATPALINPALINNLYPGIPALNLTQIDKLDPIPEFKDGSGEVWRLVKDARSGMSEIPDPQSITVTDYWNHEVTGTGGKIFIYVVEGIRPPKTARETPCRILYAWYSTTNNPGFTPQMIRPQEWLIANVYAAALTDARTGKLTALTRGITSRQAPPTTTSGGADAPAPLIRLDDLKDKETHDTGTATTPESNDNRNSRKR
jgi:hypothetical protein